MTQPNTETSCKYSQHNQMKHAANTHDATKYRNTLQILMTQPNTETCSKYSQHNQMKHAVNTHNTTKWNTLQILMKQPNTETCSKYSWRRQIQKKAANTHNTTKRNTLNTHEATKYRNTLKILMMQPNTETRCKYSQHNQIQKHAANTHNTTKYTNTLQIIITCCKQYEPQWKCFQRCVKQVTNLARTSLLFNIYLTVVLLMMWKVSFCLFYHSVHDSFAFLYIY